MAFWCIFFMRVLMLCFGMLRLISFVNRLFMYSSSDIRCDSDEVVCFPPLILYVIN